MGPGRQHRIGGFEPGKSDAPLEACGLTRDQCQPWLMGHLEGARLQRFVGPFHTGLSRGLIVRYLCWGQAPEFSWAMSPANLLVGLGCDPQMQACRCFSPTKLPCPCPGSISHGSFLGLAEPPRASCHLLHPGWPCPWPLPPAMCLPPQQSCHSRWQRGVSCSNLNAPSICEVECLFRRQGAVCTFPSSLSLCF